jgi:hypothetical protein
MSEVTTNNSATATARIHPSANPLYQGMAAYIMALLAGAIGTVISPDVKTEWYLAGTFLLLFAAGNPILGIFRKNWYSYILISTGVYLLLIAAIISTTHSLARVGLMELQDFQFFFVIVFIFYFLVTGLVGIYRFIIKILQEAI